MTEFLSSMWEKLKTLLKAPSSTAANPLAPPTDQTSPAPKPPGLDCPQCGFRIMISIPVLLSGEAIICLSCKLKLHVDQDESKACLTELRKVYDAVRRVEEIKKV